MTIFHIVLLSFKPEIDNTTVKEACDRFFRLKSECIHPSSNSPYILSVNGGRDNSGSGRSQGFTHAFIVEFENEQDRDHYAKQDPAHQVYIKWLGDKITGALGIDFAPGQV